MVNSKYALCVVLSDGNIIKELYSNVDLMFDDFVIFYENILNVKFFRISRANDNEDILLHSLLKLS